jgi:hypothetical protein
MMHTSGQEALAGDTASDLHTLHWRVVVRKPYCDGIRRSLRTPKTEVPQRITLHTLSLDTTS